MDRLGGLVLGHYELETVLGRGGMGVVYVGVHRGLRQRRAVKVLPPQLALDDFFLTRFQHEARIASELRHPNIVTIYDVGEDQGYHYIAMELVDGLPLDKLIARESPLSFERAIHILASLADALDYAHARGVVHRDLKAANIFVGPSGHVTLLDFGVARVIEGTRLTHTGMLIGTPEYIAPEALAGGESTPSADLYALGVLAYEALTGRVPFQHKEPMRTLYCQAHEPPPPPRALRPDLTDRAERVLLRQLAKEPNDRFESAGAFVMALAGALHVAVASPAEWGRTAPMAALQLGPRSDPRLKRPVGGLPAGSWVSTGGMVTPRRDHAATLLPNGLVLVAGGNDSAINRLASIEQYDPATGAWAASGRLTTPRRWHTVTSFADGQVLIVGGYAAMAERFDPAKGISTSAGQLAIPRRNHSATLLPSGQVLIAGGLDNENRPLASCELYDPVTNTWSQAPALNTARSRHIAVLLPDGRLLVTGGQAGRSERPNPLASTEILEFDGGSWIPMASMAAARVWPSASPLDRGRLLIAGGTGAGGEALALAEVYDPASDAWTETGRMAVPRSNHSATLLSNGSVLVVAGNDRPGSFLASAEIYDPVRGYWSSAGGLATARAVHTATPLRSGQVLVAGGLDAGMHRLASAEIYTPSGTAR
jgi:serine/threonine protein kinase